MTTGSALTADVRDKLTGIPHTTVYVGSVPKTVPTTGEGRIKPYIVLWPDAGDEPAEAPLDMTAPGISWGCIVTVAAYTAMEVLATAATVRARLHRQTGPGGATYVQVPNGAKVGEDLDEKPPRQFLPMEFRALTTH